MGNSVSNETLTSVPITLLSLKIIKTFKIITNSYLKLKTNNFFLLIIKQEVMTKKIIKDNKT